MAIITRQHVGKYTYLYESVSLRDDQGRPRNKKNRIGKVDAKTGQEIYDEAFLRRMAQSGTPVTIPAGDSLPAERTPQELTLDILASVRSYGSFYLLTRIAEQIGLLPVLSKTLPKTWQQLFNLACFLVATDDPLLCCTDWLSQTTAEGLENLTPQRVSDLFSTLQESDRNRFFNARMTQVQETDYLSLDITSISSFSELMQLGEWRDNSDDEAFPSINLCLLLGETTQLPVYQTIYGGSLKDVSALDTTLNEVTLLWPEVRPKMVLDNEFFSTKNMNALWLHGESEPHWRFSFLMSVPFSSNYAKSLIASEQKDMDTISNTILTSEGANRGVHKLLSWPRISPKLQPFIYFNPAKAQKDKDELYAYVTELKQAAAKDPENKRLRSEFDKYLIIPNSSLGEGGSPITIRKDVIEQKLEKTGWLVLVSNDTDNAQEAIDIYLSKDFMEKGFHRLKKAFDLPRLSVHADEGAQNKVFCGFIALILASSLDKRMNDLKLTSRYTMTELLRKAAQIKVATVNGVRVL